MGIGLPSLLLILVLVFVLFGAGKLPRVMGDIGKGVRNLRDGLNDSDKTEDDAADGVLENKSEAPIKDVSSKKTNNTNKK